MNRVLLSLAVCLGLIILFIPSVFAGFTTVDISNYCNINHRDVFDETGYQGSYYCGLGFVTWFTSKKNTLYGVPFYTDYDKLDAFSGSHWSKESMRIPLPDQKISAIYLLGSGDFASAKFVPYVTELNRFNMEIVYKDGTTEEVFPANIISKQNRWYQYDQKEGSAVSFQTRESFAGFPKMDYTAYLGIYVVVPSKTTPISEMIFNDNDAEGDYAIFGVTVGDDLPAATDTLGKAQPRRFHPIPAPMSTAIPKSTVQGNFTLFDLSAHCNQSSDFCFDYGYGIERGDVKPLVNMPLPGTYTCSGVPFTIARGKNVISGSIKGLETFTVPVGASAGKIYLLMGLMTDVCASETNPNYIDDPLYFSVDVLYEGTDDYDTFFPKEISTGAYKLYTSTPDKPLRCYVLEPLQNRKIAAIRLNDRMDNGDFALAGITLSSEAGTYARTLSPKVKLNQLPSAVSPTVSVVGDTITLENSYYRLKFSGAATKTISLTELYNKIGFVNMLGSTDNTNLFSVEVNNTSGVKRYYLKDLTAARINNRGTGLDLDLAPPDNSFTAVLSFNLDATNEIRMGTSIKNNSSAKSEYKIFNYLSNITIPDTNSTYYYYPQPRGTIDKRPFRIRKVYGGTCYQQFMDAYNPELGAGVYIRADDTWGETKVLSFSKVGSNQLIDEAWTTYHTGMYLPLPTIPQTTGVFMCFEYWEQAAEPGVSVTIPPVVFGFHRGDWHDAIQYYKNWIETNLTNIDSPAWLKDTFTNTEAHAPYMHINSKFNFWADGKFDMIRLMMPWGDIQAPPDGVIHEFQFREEYGGAAGMHAAVEAAHAKGLRVALYLEGSMFPAHFLAGVDTARLAPICVMKNKDGTAIDKQMCPGSVDWQDYLAATCARAIKESDADCIYLDSITQVGSFCCYNPDHHHSIPGQTWIHDVAQLLHKVRTAIQAVKPDAVLFSEALGADVATVELNGAYDYYFCDWVAPERFGNPKINGLNHMMYPKKKFWSLISNNDDFRFDNQAFFYGDCVVINYLMGVGKTSLSPYRQYMNPDRVRLRDILHSYKDIYMSSESKYLIQTEYTDIYANKFQKGQDIIYHILNNSFVTVHGPLIEVEGGSAKYKNLLTGEVYSPENTNGKYYISAKIKPKEVLPLLRIISTSTFAIKSVDT